MRLFGISDLPRFVNVLAGEADVRCGSGANIVLFGNDVGSHRTGGNLTTLLRGVVFIRKTALRLCLDLQRIGLSAIRGSNQFIMGILRFGWLRSYGSIERAVT